MVTSTNLRARMAWEVVAMERTDKRSRIRWFATRGVLGAVLAVGVLIVAVGVGLGGDGNKASATGGTSGAAQPTKVLKTLVFGGEITAGQDTTSLPITAAYPPVEAVSSYTVPANMRLVIESAYVTINEQFLDSRRTGFSALIGTSYPIPGCAHPGFERDYGLQVGQPVISDHELIESGSLSGPIYVEGGRQVSGSVSGSGSDSQVIALITVHGYLEPGVNPTNPKPTTTC
jgi:hypothetical protein